MRSERPEAQEGNDDRPPRAVVVERVAPDAPLVLAFAGQAGGLGVPPYAFWRLFGDRRVNRLFVRDLEQSWYHDGLRGHTTSWPETLDFLTAMIGDIAHRRLVVFGNSMGAHAALVFGMLRRADVVHAFSPQTLLTDITHFRYPKSHRAIERLHRTHPRDHFDLRELAAMQGVASPCHVWFDTGDEFDRFHAANVEGLANVTMHPIDGGGHALVRHLRERGDLRRIVDEALGPTPSR